MKKNILLLTTAITALLLAGPAVYAQEAAPTAVVATPGKLPDAKEKIYKDALDQLHAKNKVIYSQIDKLQQEASAIMTADKFDKAAFLAKNADIEKAYAQVHTNTAETVASVAAQFTADERRIMEARHQNHRTSVQIHPPVAAAPAAK